ncbi:MAG TPA: efflux transporter outer membrane subunit, partial [Sphingomicrobium sp.]|nr:efflux transporter outer membrane subunit [Sphingomicrobium sp.]
ASGCMSLEPAYERPRAAVPQSWPVGDSYLVQSEAALPAVTYKDIFRDPRLQTLIVQALANNEDLAAAAANVAAAREQYHIQRSNQFPELNAGAGAVVTGDRDDGKSGSYQAGLRVPSFEIDLFGRLRSLSHAELQRYFATESGARATRLALVASIADAWLLHAADSSLRKIAGETARSAATSVKLTRARLEGGVSPRTDLRQAEGILAAAQADVAQQTTLVAQDVNALQLLVGGPVDPALLSTSIDEAAPTVASLPAGLDSSILLRRPDVLEAEYQLRAANAEIGAARAALFPSISLTGLLGVASSALTSLFSGGAFAWSVGADATYNIFDAGAGRANVRLSEAQRQAALADYQKAIQTAFREVADALARRGTMGAELQARMTQAAAAADNLRLSEARYRAGIENFLATLDAQRSSYSAQRTLVATKLDAARNLVDLYQALGGDDELRSTPVGLAPTAP